MIKLNPCHLALAGSFFALCLSAYAEKAPVITSTDNEDKTVCTVKIDGELFTKIVTGQVEGYPPFTKPFLYPIIGPTGAEMTRGYPMVKDKPGEATDHPHHQSLWFAHGSVNGLDFWTSAQNKARTTAELITGPNRNPYENKLNSHWIGPDQKPVAEASDTYRFSVLADGSRIIDYKTRIVPAEGVEQLVFGDTKEGTMAIRVHPALRLKGEVATGHCINSEGDKDGDCWGKRAKWVAYWGVIDGKTCGVAIFDHPTNLRHPTWWHARDYGLVAANPFGIHDFEKKPKGTGDFTLKQDESLNLSYRFVFFAGTTEEAKVAEKYEQWVKETMPEEKQEAEAQKQ